MLSASALWRGHVGQKRVCVPKVRGQKASIFCRSDKTFWQCRHCRKQTSVTAGAPLANSKLSLRVWWLAIYLTTQSKNAVAALELGRQLGCATALPGESNTNS